MLCGHKWTWACSAHIVITSLDMLLCAANQASADVQARMHTWSSGETSSEMAEQAVKRRKVHARERDHAPLAARCACA